MTHFPWRTGPVPAEVPNGTLLLVRDTAQIPAVGVLKPRHCYVSGVACKRDLDPKIHTWIKDWCLLDDIEKALAAAAELVEFHDKYVHTVRDGAGHELGEQGSCEWSETVDNLRDALGASR